MADEIHFKLFEQWLSSPRARNQLEDAAKDAIRLAGFPVDAGRELLSAVRNNATALERVEVALNAMRADKANDGPGKLHAPVDRPSSSRPSSLDGPRIKKKNMSSRKKNSGSSKVPAPVLLGRLIPAVMIFILLILTTVVSQNDPAQGNLRRVVDINQTSIGGTKVIETEGNADMKMKSKVQVTEERISSHDSTSTVQHISDKEINGKFHNPKLFFPDFKTSTCTILAQTRFLSTQVESYGTAKECCEAK